MLNEREKQPKKKQQTYQQLACFKYFLVIFCIINIFNIIFILFHYFILTKKQILLKLILYVYLQIQYIFYVKKTTNNVKKKNKKAT